MYGNYICMYNNLMKSSELKLPFRRFVSFQFDFFFVLDFDNVNKRLTKRRNESFNQPLLPYQIVSE